MSIGDVVKADRVGRHMSQLEYASQLHMDRTALSRIENGDRGVPSTYDPALARQSWKIALQIADERTGGFIGNILDHLPNLDLHPASLKDVLLTDLDELNEALGGLSMARHIDPAKRKESAERVWHEMRDVIEKAIVLQGVIEEEFALDRDKLVTQHEDQVRRGER